jgi:2-dehydro-3-deoxyphosphooctonate aldolase (KDO 8-P synthase)
VAGLWSSVPVLISGPCVLEDDAVNVAIANHLRALGSRLGIRVVFKGSFDKANRSAVDFARGPGIDRGLAALAVVREATGLPVVTDVHEVWQVERAAGVVDALQIPAFLCRQTDLLIAAGGTGLPVNIKKGQWMAADAMRGAVDKVRHGGTCDVAVTERGSFFGYGDLVVDMRTFARIRASCDVPVFMDATHAVQRPGLGSRGSSGGEREHTMLLAAAAAAAGAAGWFVETHPNPAASPSDAETIWPLDGLDGLVERALAVWGAVREEGALPWRD